VSDSRVSRRTLLFVAATSAAAAGLNTGLSGCESDPARPAVSAETVNDPLTPVLTAQQTLLVGYERTLSAFPEFTVSLSDLQAQATAHTEALRKAAPAAAAQVADAPFGSDPSSGLPPGLPSGSPSGQPVPSPAPPADPATALANLARLVDAALGSLRAAALRADGDLAALLGSCAASTACHSRLLG